MVVVDLRRSKPPIAFYDSLKESRDGTYYVRAIANYLRREWLDKIRKGASDMPTFRLRPYTPTYVPKQMNDSDCGVLLLHYAEVLSESASLRESSLSQSLSQERIQQIRHSLVEHIFFGED
jgi:Ulp1 family protease